VSRFGDILVVELLLWLFAVLVAFVAACHFRNYMSHFWR